MELSYYNISYTEEGFSLVYNTFTKSFVKLPSEEWEYIQTNVNGMEFSTENILVKEGIVVESALEQLVQFKYYYHSKVFSGIYPLLYIAPTMSCNLRCFYCFEGSNKRGGVMPESTIGNMITMLKKSSNKHINIVWFGGEPLLGYSSILQICKKMQESLISFKSSMITNGTLLTKDKINTINELNLDYVQISIDGIAKDHDKRRMFNDGRPSFDIIMDNVDYYLRHSNIRFIFQVTVDKSNLTCYDDVVEYSKERFSSFIENHRVRIGKNYVQNRTGFDSDNKCLGDTELIEDKIADSEKNNKTIGFPSLAIPCMYRRKGFFAIDSNGDIFKCIEHLGDKTKKIGSVNEHSISLPALSKCTFENDPFEDAECKTCNVLPICGGGCPIDCIKFKKGEIASRCSYYKHTIPHLLPYYYSKIKSK